MFGNALEAVCPGDFPNEVSSQNVTPIRDRRPVIAAKIASDLGKSSAASAAVGRISGQAVRPSVGNIDHRAAGQTLLHLRLERVIVGSEDVDEEEPRAIANKRP